MASSKAIANSTLVFRILALLLLAASVVIMATNSFTDKTDGTKTKFSDIFTYRYVVAVGMVGSMYLLVQMPFAVHHVCTQKRWIGNGFLPVFDFYGDKVISFLLATAAGAGFWVTFELKKLLNGFLLGGAIDDQTKTFLDKGYISTGLLFLGFICMAILSVLSSITPTTTSKKGFFG